MAGKKRIRPRLTTEELERRAENRRLAYERAEFHRAMAEKLGERERERKALAE